MNYIVMMVIGGALTLLLDYAVFRRIFGCRRFTVYENMILQSLAFLQCQRHGAGAEAVLQIGNDRFEEWEYLAAFEKLLAEGYVEAMQEPTHFGLSAHGQLLAVKMFDQRFPTQY